MKKLVSSVVVGILAVTSFQGAVCLAAPLGQYDYDPRIVAAVPTSQRGYNSRIVSSAAELALSLEEGKAKELQQIKVKLARDITLNGNLKLPNGTELDLNGHNLFISPNASLTVGEKIEVRHEETIHHPPKFVTKSETKYITSSSNSSDNTKETRYYDVLVPAHDEKVVKYSYLYNDDFVVKIFSSGGTGRIVGLRCEDAPDDVKKGGYAFKGAKGKTGDSSCPVFNILSGSLFVKNLTIKACDGGNGGRATYAGFGFIFGGSGGDGGDGGKGADVFCVEPEHGRVVNMGSCIFLPGKGGQGGAGSRHNPSYLLAAGSDGAWGMRGKDGKVINYPEHLIG